VVDETTNNRAQTANLESPDINDMAKPVMRILAGKTEVETKE